MRKSLRLVLATATGAALFATGAAITVASPASAGIVSARAIDIPGDVEIKDKFLPPTGTDTMGFSFVLEDPYIDDGADKGKPAKKLWAQFTKDNSVSTPTWAAASITQPAAVSASSVTADSKVTVNGTIPVASNDTPGEKWQLRIGFTDPSATTAPTSWEKTTPAFAVGKATRVTGASIDPNPVYLKSGKEVDVTVQATVDLQGATVTDVRLEDEDESEHYALTTNVETDDSYHDSTSMDYSTATGNWRLKFTIKRGSKTYSFVKGFEVRKSGSSSKATSRITLYASPAKVKLGKSTKLYGKVYRGSKGWGSKVLKLYFKKKGTSKWKFVGYVEAGSTGKYSKTLRPKYDGYWRTRAVGTSKTYGSLSNYKFVDVR